MILYHGSNIKVTNIDLDKCRPYKDFGQGFYMTDILEQASQMAMRVVRLYGGKPCVSAFNFDEVTFTSGLIDIDTLIRGLEYKSLTTQYSFHTKMALKYCEPTEVPEWEK